jgi:hypothetical protein
VSVTFPLLLDDVVSVDNGIDNCSRSLILGNTLLSVDVIDDDVGVTSLGFCDGLCKNRDKSVVDGAAIETNISL